MKKSKKYTFLAALGVLLLGSAGAMAWSLSNRDELSGAFCGALDKPATYKDSGMMPYAYLIKGRDGWIFRTENDFRKKWALEPRTEKYLADLQNAMAKRNTQLVILMPPVRGMVHAEHLTRSQLKRYGLKDMDGNWTDYESSVADAKRKGIHFVGIDRAETTPYFFYKRDHHWTAEGASIAAKKVADEIKKMDIYQKIPRQEFATTQKEPAVHKSSFEKVFKKVCKTELPDEKTPVYETTGAKAAGENDLFSDGNTPQIILLGTSNSTDDASQANFDGFLKQYLSADILNLSYAGAGIDTSIMSFLNSEYFANDLPKIAIWEVPGYYDFNIMDDKLFNQIIPASYGACSSDFIRSRSLKIDNPNQTVIFNLEEPEKSGPQTIAFNETGAEIKDWSKMYLHLSFTDPVSDDFSVKFEYKDGGTKRQDFGRSDRYPDDGEFYTLFPGNKQELRRIVLVPPKNLASPLNVDVQVCARPETEEDSATGL